jgi:hypothetical protein
MLSACKATCSSDSPPWSPHPLLHLLLRCLLGLCLLSPLLLAALLALQVLAVLLPLALVCLAHLALLARLW